MNITNLHEWKKRKLRLFHVLVLVGYISIFLNLDFLSSLVVSQTKNFKKIVRLKLS